MKYLKLFEMFFVDKDRINNKPTVNKQTYILIEDIIPDDEISKNKPYYYPKGTEFEIKPNGYYVPISYKGATKGMSLAGWIYKNYKNSQVYPLTLIEGVDYIKK
jgi:hypothetical protein